MRLNSRSLVLVYSGICISMIFWSWSFLWYKDAYLFFGPMTTIFLRLIISAIMLTSIAYFTGKLKVKKEHYPYFLLVAFFEPFLYFIGESFGMQLVSPITASVIVSTIPIMTPMATSFIYKEKLTLINVAGIGLSFVGVSMVILNKGMRLDASLTGVLLMFLAVIAAVGYALSLKKLTPHYEALTVVAVQNSIGTILFAPLFFIFEWNSFVSGFSVNAMVPIINLSIFASSVAFILYANGVKVIGMSKASTFTNLIPVLTAIFTYFFYKEQFSSMKIAGIIVVVGGLFLSQINESFYLKLVTVFVDRKKNKF